MLNRDLARRVGWPGYVRRYVWRQFNKRVLRRGVTVRLPTGLAMYAPPWSQSASEVYYAGCDVDWGSERLFVDSLDADGVLIDVGAHVGYYALYAAPLVRKVYAFEADARSFQALARNLAPVPGAEPVHRAVYSASGTMAIERSAALDGFSHLVPGAEAADTAPVIAIDDWMAGRAGERVTGIKIDIDGLDFEVVRGAARTIARDRPLVLTEFSRSPANSFAALAAFLERAGYAAFAFRRAAPRATRLRRLAPETTDHAAVKMLFLVPPRLEARFAALAE